MADFSVKFVSQKINKIRWRPQVGVQTSPSSVFATGSWDDYENSVSIWRIEDKIADSCDDDDGMENILEHEPQKVCEVSHTGNVMAMQYLSSEVLTVASSTGNLSLMKHKPNSTAISNISNWEGIHSLNGGGCCPCTCIATRGDDWIATGGEDGKLVVVCVGQKEPVHRYDKDSCTINALAFLKQSEIISVNSFGQLKTFDLRQDSNKAAQVFSITESHTPLMCVDKHPGQAHIVATGGEDGMLTIWDLRQEKFPMTLLEAHTATIWEAKFHPQNPLHLFTCSDDGSLWHWDGSSFTSEPISSFIPVKGQSPNKPSNSGITSPWLTLETSRHKLEIASLLPNKSLPVNSLDIQRSRLLCGTDSETIYSINLPMLG